MAAFVGTRAVAKQLFDVAPTDPAVYVGVALFLLAVAVAASSVPALRASRIDPIRALRAE